MELQTLIHQLITQLDTLTKADLITLKRQFARETKLKDIPSNIQLIACYHQMIKDGEIEPLPALEQILTKSPIRSQSGIVSVQVLTKPFRCPGKCIFCPNDFTMPKSYINTEPGAQRALLNNFDPIKQVYNRLLSLTLTGHQTDKIEMIILGGTRDVYPDEYKEQFVKGLYDACNTFPEFYDAVKLDQTRKRALSYTVGDYDITYPETINESQTINETGPARIIGLTVETRPEYVTDDNCRFWRRLGVTRLEMGIQSSDDTVLEMNKRGHDHERSRQAVHTLRQYGFKMSVHIMPGLYGSDYTKDLQTFIDIYDDPAIRPDEIKFYPTSVIPNTELYDLYQSGEYTPLETATIMKLIKETFRSVIPPYTRIKRLIRDIPSTEIAAGSSITNLSQLARKEIRESIVNTNDAQTLYAQLYTDMTLYTSLENYIANGIITQIGDDQGIITSIIGQQPDLTSYRNFVALDTRSREIKHRSINYKGMPPLSPEGTLANIVIRQYRSSVGQEFFVSIEDELGYLYGFTRLLLPDAEQSTSRECLGPDTAMIRELHVYGKLQGLTLSNISADDGIQHRGMGTQLMSLAEHITLSRGYHSLAVISGIGVRGFYSKIGYTLSGTYMVKNLQTDTI